MRDFYLWYTLIGMAYWAVNIFIRKLHLKNDNNGAELIVLMWIFLWPICFLALIVFGVSDMLKKNKI